jgi:myo-inositol 2-dehydrogenase / D-chiro-inositol 1-dehydrogenase
VTPMRVGLIGYGAWGQQHARAFAQAPSAELAAIASSGSAASARRDWPDAAIVEDWRALLDDRSLEAVVIAVPNALHAEIASAALASGEHVLLEKPMALTIADCDRLIEAAKRSGRVLTVGHELRVSRQWGRVRALLTEGAIGELRHAAISLFRFPYRTGTGGWRYEGASVGSWILEEPVHFFDLLLWYGLEWGPPVALRALADGDPAMPRALLVTLRFAGGHFATLHTVVAGFEHHLVLQAMGEAGAIRATWSAAMDRSTAPVAALHIFRGRAGPGEGAEPVPFGESGEVFELALQAEAAVQGFREGRALVPPEEARDAVRCCLLAERSAREGGREIAWNAALD